MTTDSGRLVSDFDYHLPTELIAQTPIEPRDSSRMLVVSSDSPRFLHLHVTDLPEMLDPGDLLVANNSQVLPARLLGHKQQTGGKVEILLLNPTPNDTWEALAKPARRLPAGTMVEFTSHDGSKRSKATIGESLGDGVVSIFLEPQLASDLESFGEAPLPPYITEHLDDPARYQTTYATVPGSAAAPTAGLHITNQLRERLADRGVGWAEVTLHIGLDTFRLLTVEAIDAHRMHSEHYVVPAETLLQIRNARVAGKRVVAIGTTSARTLESIASEIGSSEAVSGATSIYITPGYQWQVVDAMLTNFHLPRSTLLMMVSALAGREPIRRAYAEAIDSGYRFFSFGDAMFISGRAGN